MNISFGKAEANDFDYFYQLRYQTMLELDTHPGKIWDDHELVLHKRSFDPATLLMIHADGQRIEFANITQQDSDISVSLFCINPQR